jgi:16S rRNA processing protein RimM
MMKWDALAVVGRIARAHGIKGQVIVNPETDFPEERFQPGAELLINREGSVRPLTVTSVRFQRDRPVIGLLGIDDMNAASALAGAELRVPVESLAALPEGMFYHHDLVGCRVVTRAGETVGLVAGVEGGVGGHRLVLATPAGEVLIPLARDICTTIDVSQRQIVIEPPNGLLDLNARPRRNAERTDADRHRDDLSGDGRADAGDRHRRSRD